MGSVVVEKCGGMLPAWDDRFLPNDQAAFARNTFLYSGAVVGWRQPKLLRNLLNSAAKFAYRVPTIAQGIAAANLLFLSNPTAGDTVTLGEVVYKFVATPTKPYDVLLGATAAQTASALFSVMQYGLFDPTVAGIGTAANPAISGETAQIGWPTALVAGTNTPGANTVILVPVTASATMTLTSVSMVVQTTAALAKFKALVYENVNQINSAGTAYTNIPSSLVGTGAEVVGSTAGQTITSALNVPVTIQSGALYWVGFMMDTAVALQKATSGTSAVSMNNTYASGPPNPFQTTALSGVTVGGSTVGSLQTQFNTGQSNWQVWATLTPLTSTDPINTLATTQIGGAGPSYSALELQAPAFGAAFNQTPVAKNSAAVVWLKDFASISDTTTAFVGGANQTADTTITGASTWLEFLDQDTNVLRTPVVDDSFQRYYFASPSQPPSYNTYQRIATGQPVFYLGVPAPPIAPTLAAVNGGNPTQVGFVGSKTGSGSFQFLQPWFQGTSMMLGQFGSGAWLGGSLVALYPMQVSVGAVANDVAIMLNNIGPNGEFGFVPMIFNDISATSPINPTTGLPTQSNAPGTLLASGTATPGGPLSGVIVQGTSYVPGGGTIALPAAVVGVFANPPTLAPNTQYWIGAMLAPGGELPSQQSGADVELGKGDLNTDGWAAYEPPFTSFPTDPSTGVPSAFSNLAPNFLDLQLWADLTPGSLGTSAQEETRAYVYTWVTAYGEEGPPSAPSLLDGYDNATWVVGLQPPLAEDMGILRNIVKTNIYRTMASVQGGTVYFFVGSVSANATTFTDNYTDDVVATNLILPSTTWFGPPTALQGFVAMPNGMMAGFKANEVWFSEPFRPHAWPAGYVMTTDYPIIGLGVTGTTLVAATQFNPQAFTGVNPSTMSQNRIPLPEPCMSRGGILSTENGVYYPSANGLVKVTGGGVAANITQSWISRDKWDKYTPQKFVRAAKNVSTYFAFGTTGVTNGQADSSVAQQGFTIELSEVAETTSFTLWPQVGGHRIGFSTLVSPLGGSVDNVLGDPWSGVTLLITGGAIQYYDFTDQAPTITPVLWRSKKFQGPHKENFAAFRVWFDIPPGGPQSPPATRTTVPFTSAPPTTAKLTFRPGMFGVVRIIADGKYITERELRYSTELMRVSSQSKYTTWQIEYEGVVSVTMVKMATTVKELGLIEAGAKR